MPVLPGSPGVSGAVVDGPRQKEPPDGRALRPVQAGVYRPMIRSIGPEAATMLVLRLNKDGRLKKTWWEWPDEERQQLIRELGDFVNNLLSEERRVTIQYLSHVAMMVHNTHHRSKEKAGPWISCDHPICASALKSLKEMAGS